MSVTTPETTATCPLCNDTGWYEQLTAPNPAGDVTAHCYTTCGCPAGRTAATDPAACPRCHGSGWITASDSSYLWQPCDLCGRPAENQPLDDEIREPQPATPPAPCVPQSGSYEPAPVQFDPHVCEIIDTIEALRFADADPALINALWDYKDLHEAEQRGQAIDAGGEMDYEDVLRIRYRMQTVILVAQRLGFWAEWLISRRRYAALRALVRLTLRPVRRPRPPAALTPTPRAAEFRTLAAQLSSTVQPQVGAWLARAAYLHERHHWFYGYAASGMPRIARLERAVLDRARTIEGRRSDAFFDRLTSPTAQFLRALTFGLLGRVPPNWCLPDPYYDLFGF